MSERKEEEIYKLYDNYSYEYVDPDIKNYICSFDKTILEDMDINNDAVIFLANHYTKLYKRGTFQMTIQSKIDSMLFKATFYYNNYRYNPSNSLAFFNISIRYCNIRKYIIRFNINMSQINEEIQYETVIYNLLYHYHFLLRNAKFNNNLNIIYFNESDIEYNNKVCEYKKEILFNIYADDMSSPECVVCYDCTNFKTPCNHFLCLKCFTSLKDTRCPMCRQTISQEEQDIVEYDDYEI